MLSFLQTSASSSGDNRPCSCPSRESTVGVWALGFRIRPPRDQLGVGRTIGIIHFEGLMGERRTVLISESS